MTNAIWRYEVIDMLNFTVGPVQMGEEVRNLGSGQIPYFRTSEFSAVVKENERLFLEFADAPQGSRAVFLTGSGTAGMEAAVMNTLSASDRALVVDGGGFGHRFAQICEVHGIPCDVVRLEAGRALRADHLEPYEGGGHTAFLVNLCETSTGVLYDLELISEFCGRNDLFLIVDAVSAFLADELSMAQSGVDVVITGSQKALALPPGMSLLALSPRALERVAKSDPRCLYFDLRAALADGDRGQTPFTPAVGVVLQMNARLRQIEECGLAAERERIAALAADFRRRAQSFPFSFLAESPSNAVTALRTNGASARVVVDTLKDDYGIWVCPNGGELSDSVFRVGHIGDLTLRDNDRLFAAFDAMVARGLMEAVR